MPWSVARWVDAGLEWAHQLSARVRSIVPIAACMQATAQQIAWGAIGRPSRSVRPAMAGVAITTTRSTAMDRRKDSPSPPDRPGPRSAATTCSPIGSVASETIERRRRHVGLWQQFEVERYLEYTANGWASLRCKQIPRGRTRRGSARHRAYAARWRRRWRESRSVAGDRDLSDSCTVVSATNTPRAAHRSRDAELRTSRSLHRTVTTAFWTTSNR